MNRHPNRTFALFALFLVAAGPLHAGFTDCATSWSNFDNPGFISQYTSQGQVIADEETSADTSHGPAAVTPAWTDLASGSPGAFPGPEATSFFGYYNGGTVYDPNDPATMEDDYILFRMRVEGDPSTGPAFDSKHWNVLFDVDGDGYKEYWVDLDGSFGNGNANDRLQILYDNSNRQDIPDPDAARVEVFTAWNSEDMDPSCTAPGSPGLSHTRTYAVGDGTPDYYIEMQIPMTAFNDENGNQVLFPDSPVAFVFSTGASNQDPLQKDFMQDLDFLTLADPITFGDIIIPNGQPLIEFTDIDLEPVNFYSLGEDVYIYLTDPNANSDPNLVECITVTVSDPATGDDEQVTLCESGPNTGIFTNRGGTCAVTITNPSPAPDPPTAWLVGITTSAATIAEDWTLTYDAGNDNWIVEGLNTLGVQSGRASHGVPYTTDGGELSFTLYQNGPIDGTVLSTCTFAADPLPTASGSASDGDGIFQVVSGDDIFVAYTSQNFVTVTDTARIVGTCEAFISFTRATGLPSSSFELTNDPATSDKLYVTVFHTEANTDPAVAETISVVLTGNDQQTLTLTETGPDTGEFRNTTGLDTQIDDLFVTVEDNLWEDIDTGVVTATYDYICGGSPFSVNTDASLFFTAGGGRVAFTNGAGTLDVDIYGSGLPVWLQVTDDNACAAPDGSLQVVVTTPAGDSETITVYETFPGSGVYMNNRRDLVTTAGSAVVTSASSAFLTDGVQAGDTFAIATGPDLGLYTVASVDSETQITLTTTLSTTRTGIAFSAMPLMTATSDGVETADDLLLEADDQDVMTVSYSDCDDGDSDGTNDVKIDTALYNAPSLLINEVLFYPDTASTSCQTEAVELFNASSMPITATGYEIRDEDGFSYTVPQFQGADLVLGPGEFIYLSLWDASPPNDFFLNGVYYLFTSAGSTFPSDRFADPDNTDPADQVMLFDAGGIVRDYFGWSSTLSPSLDFYSDDAAAVLRSIWQDDAFANSSGIPLGSSMARMSDGFDTNSPDDWTIATNSTCDIITTRAFVSSFRAFPEAGRVVAEWETSSESGTLGFYLFRLTEGGRRYVQVTRDLVPALLDAPQGGIYRVIDRGARGSSLTYVLMEVEATRSGSRHRFHGPFEVTVDEAVALDARKRGRRRGRSEEAISHAVAPKERARLEAHSRGRRRRAGTEDGAARGRGRVKISVGAEGLHVVSAEELAALFGTSRDKMARWLSLGLVRLSHRGRSMPWTVVDGRLYFWGEAIDSLYTSENAYWLELGPGSQMSTLRARRRGGSGTGGESFLETRDIEEDRFPATLYTRDPESDYWYWQFVSSGHATLGEASFRTRLEGLAEGKEEARLRVRLFGASETLPDPIEEHHARVRVNGVVVGEDRWDGIGKHSFEARFTQGLLHDGENEIVVEGVLDTGAPFDIFYIDGFELSYRRSYHALQNELVFGVEAAGSVLITGFESRDILLLDVTDAKRPRLVAGADIEKRSNGFALSFDAPRANAVYAAVALDRARSPLAARVGRSSLRAPSNRAEYIVIAPAGLSDGAERLAELRRARGLDAAVVSLEDIMNEFHFGIWSPHAIPRFLAFARENWAAGPSAVVLAGAGNVDYRNLLGVGGNLVPTIMAATPDGLFASDNRLADLDGDAWPDMAIGRIPVLSNDELRAYVDKLAAFEQSGGSILESAPLLVADDDPWKAAQFDRHSESMAALLPAGSEAERLYLTEREAGEARARLLALLGAGVPWVNYVGHGGLDRFGDETLLHTTDVPALGNGSRLTLFTAFSCSINRFELVGFQSLGEALTVEPTGGAAAVWAPSGLSVDVEAQILGSAFFEAVYERGSLTLGEAIREALSVYRERRGETVVPTIYNLLGDPALELSN